MATIFINSFSGRCQVRKVHQDIDARGIKMVAAETDGLGINDFYLTHNGRILEESHSVRDNGVYHVIPRLSGGKGGFGSMLRAIGAQIEKTTSREACRDLSGRRMRDVNNEKKLREWVGKQADREREKEERRKERMARRKATPRHNFDDPEYMNQKAQVLENLEDALQQGLQKTSSDTPSTTTSEATRKRATPDAAAASATSAKKAKGWIGMDMEDLSDLDSESDSDSTEGGATSSNSNEASMMPQSDKESHSDSGRGTPPPTEPEQGMKAEKLSKESNGESLPPPDTSEGQAKRNGDGQPEEVAAGEADCSRKPHGLLSALESQQPKASSDEEQKTNPGNTESPEPVDLEQFHSAAELESAGLERLKLSLIALGLKCGGTLEERAARLFSVKGLSKDQIDPSLFAKPSKGKGKGKKSKN